VLPARLPSPAQVVVLVAALLAACSSWRHSPDPLAKTLADRPGEVRVWRTDGTRFTLRRPRLSGDTLIGEGAASRQSTVAVPLGEIASMEVRRFDGLKTAGLIAGVGATAILVAAAASDGSDPGPVDDGGNVGGGGGYYSCPLVYSWNGKQWRLDSGTFGGAIARALARTDVDNLAYAVAQRDTLQLRLANELRETDHVDELAVLAVDHPADVSVAPTPDGALRTIGRLSPPVSARDSRGRDALEQVREVDQRVWESALVRRDTSRLEDVRDALELTFRRPAGPHADLVIDARNTLWSAFLVGELVRAHGRETEAWYASLEADATRATGLRRHLATDAFLSVSVLGTQGWETQGLAWEAGPEIAKRQVVTLDLTGAPDTLLRIRLEAPAAFWTIDHVALASEPQARLTVREAHLASARLASGQDAAELLRARDGAMLTLEPGESAEVRLTVPEPEPGLVRSYLLRTHGWYRIHTRTDGEPDPALLAAVLDRPGGVSRTAAARLNRTLDRLEAPR
jgi:hypothetical protein